MPPLAGFLEPLLWGSLKELELRSFSRTFLFLYREVVAI